MRLSRRNMLAGAAGSLAAAAAGFAQVGSAQERRGRRRRLAQEGPAVVNGRIHQSVCEWCFTGDCSSKPMSLEDLCKLCVELGVKSVELVDPPGWPTLKKYNLICALANSHGFVNGFNDPANWEMCIDKTKTAIDDCAAAGFPSVIVFPGFRHGIPDDVGLENTVKGLKKIIGYAEQKKINLIMEVLNSRVDVEMKGHPDYMGDSVEWCVEACKQVGSERLKILFDIYHVQIMQGDIITRIKQFADYIGHYHTAGNPGRNELDDNQEINYPPIMRAIVETGYQGFVAQEFIPTRDPATSLREAVSLCDV
ncbi:MAG: TIM barrel protein [Planctomycetaceae bacterium]|nr:TIM barrel protein [Planctomycetaceae bacterium]